MSQRRYDLVAFDVDGTLINHPTGKVVWNLFNERFAPANEEVHSRMARYLAGEISYERWVELDVSDWIAFGVRREQLAEVVRAELQITPGVQEALLALSEAGYRLAVISGTLDLTLHELLDGQPFDVVLSNRLFFDDEGRIVGWEATRYDMAGKATALRQISEQLGTSARRAVYVGDNINDVDAMAAAGLAVAFEPKSDAVLDAADAVIEGDMRRLLEVLSV